MTPSRLPRLGGTEREGEDGYVVLLTVSLGCTCDLMSRSRGDRLSAFEAEELALRVLGLDYTIREKGKAVAAYQRESCLSVFGSSADAKRQSGFKRDFPTIVIRREVAGIGDDQATALRNLRAKAGGESA